MASPISPGYGPPRNRTDRREPCRVQPTRLPPVQRPLWTTSREIPRPSQDPVRCRILAWTFQEGWTAPQCAGVIHSDFERGFIKAEVYHYNDLMKYKSESAIKEAGALRLEGKDYLVKDGDVMHFRFNV